MNQKEQKEFFEKHLNAVNLICTRCGVEVAYTNRLLTKEDRESFICCACLLVEKGFWLIDLNCTGPDATYAMGVN